MSVGTAAAERAHRHAAQKAYRDLHRESNIASTTFQVAFSGSVTPEVRARMEAMQSEFEWANGREKGWIDLSIDQRIDHVYARLGSTIADRLHVARFALYRHSSEILHGTLFGAHFFLGLSEPRPDVNVAAGIANRMAWMHMAAQASVFQAIAAVVESFDAAYGFEEASTQVRNLHGLIRQLPGMGPAE